MVIHGANATDLLLEYQRRMELSVLQQQVESNKPVTLRSAAVFFLLATGNWL